MAKLTKKERRELILDARWLVEVAGLIIIEEDYAEASLQLSTAGAIVEFLDKIVAKGKRRKRKKK